MTLQPVPTGL